MEGASALGFGQRRIGTSEARISGSPGTEGLSVVVSDIVNHQKVGNRIKDT